MTLLPLWSLRTPVNMPFYTHAVFIHRVNGRAAGNVDDMEGLGMGRCMAGFMQQSFPHS